VTGLGHTGERLSSCLLFVFGGDSDEFRSAVDSILAIIH
jgi:hypothetical protein